MYCSRCGTSNPEGAQSCSSCGAALAPAQVTAPAQPVIQTNVIPHAPLGGEKIPTHLVLSLISLICCCLPMGVVALIYSLQVDKKQAAGDIAGARSASNTAKWCALLGIIGGLLANGVALAISGPTVWRLMQNLNP